MRRCSTCILPESYPGIRFNVQGICNFCSEHQTRAYPGNQALNEHILSFLHTHTDRNEEYDCVLAFDGGQASSYLLYLLTQQFRLKVLAYSVDNDFIPSHTRFHMRNMTDALRAKLVNERDDRLARCVPQHVRALLHSPSPAMVGLLCSGCRSAVRTRLLAFARSNRIPVVVTGSHPAGSASYRKRLLRLAPTHSGKLSLVLGYARQIARNPFWVSDLFCLRTQVEGLFHDLSPAWKRPGHLLQIAPFDAFIRWEEAEISATIETELGWMHQPGAPPAWQGDCDIAVLQAYLDRKLLGFNAVDERLSYLVRDAQLSRAAALARMEEQVVSDEMVRGILDRMGIDNSCFFKVALTFC